MRAVVEMVVETNNVNDADFVTILSSELIATVVEAYFNTVMYKVPVKVVDLKPTSDGYAFSLAFVTDSVANVSENVVKSDEMAEFAGKVADMFDMVNENGVKRDNKGRFATMKQDKEAM